MGEKTVSNSAERELISRIYRTQKIKPQTTATENHLVRKWINE